VPIISRLPPSSNSPKKEGGDTIHRWLYTADINRLPDGDCNTDDLDEVYAAGPDGRFTNFIGANASGPNFDKQIDGWALSTAGYKLWDFMLKPDPADAGRWHLKLGLMQLPKARLP
jgi:hypothetical protein